MDGEVEDLLPPSVMAHAVDRYLRKPGGVEDDFVDVVRENVAFVPQVEQYARRHNIPLDEDWKVGLAKRVKTSILRAKDDALRNEPQYVDIWRNIFQVIHASEPHDV